MESMGKLGGEDCVGGWVEGAPKSREEIYHKPGQHSGVKKRMRESPKRWR